MQDFPPGFYLPAHDSHDNDLPTAYYAAHLLFIYFRHARTAPAFSFFFISHDKAKANAKHILEHKVGSFSKK
jgi:hypothetical protein